MTAEDDLRQLTRMIRTGLDGAGNAAELSAAIDAAIAKAEAAYSAVDPKRLVEDVTRLRLCTLKAEAYYQKGQCQRAVETLTPVWNILKPRLDRTPASRFHTGQTPNASLLRQQLWALLHYVFYRYYTLEGH